MRSPHFLLCVLLFAASLPAAGEGGLGIAFLPQNRKPVETDRISDDELRNRQQAASSGVIRENAARRGFKFEELSTFLTFGGHSVLLPKGAVIHLPDALARHSVAAIEGELIGWQDFLTRYPALVSTFEVTLKEASGAEAIDAERLDAVAAGGRIVVAVLDRSPISVHAARVPAADEVSR